MKLRLDKYLSDQGYGTRSQVKILIRKGKAVINGQVIKHPEFKVDISSDQIVFCGKPCRSYELNAYYMLHKPAGVISATKDQKDRTALELLGRVSEKNLFPVGRLDKDTEGLLIFTNDGPLAHELLTPKKHVDKCYYAELDREAQMEDIMEFSKGLSIGGGECAKPAKLEILDDKTHVLCTVCEGKYHQVKRMFHAVGKEVLYLKRLSMGNLYLDPDLKPGEYRKLTQTEVEVLKQSCKRDLL